MRVARCAIFLERVTGIEPVFNAWEAFIITTIRYPPVSRIIYHASRIVWRCEMRVARCENVRRILSRLVRLGKALKSQILNHIGALETLLHLFIKGGFIAGFEGSLGAKRVFHHRRTDDELLEALLVPTELVS